MSAQLCLTIRLIKSFEYRTTKNLIIHVEPSLKVEELIALIQAEIKAKQFKAYLINQFDTLKIFMKPHGSKTSNLVINLGDDDKLTLGDKQKTLADYDIQNEYELSFFNKQDYLKYLEHPDVVKW